MPRAPAQHKSHRSSPRNRHPEALDRIGEREQLPFAYFSAKHLGEGQFYLFAIHDRAGQAFDGGSIYRLVVPANVPVRLYWSATVYDRATHALIRELPWS